MASFLSILAGFCLILVLLEVNGQLDENDMDERAKHFAEMMKYDGVKRVISLTAANYQKHLKKSKMVVLFHAQNDPKKLDEEKHLLEVVAKVFDGRKIWFAESNVLKYQEVAENSDVKFVGVIKIFNDGRISNYLGQRTADVMVPYISRLFESPVIEIDSKVRRKQFDQVDLPKVVAYVSKGSKEMNELEKSSRSFQPMIPFYAVFNSKMAKSFQLKKLNSLLFIKPYEKQLALGSKVPFLEKEIVHFVNENKKQIMKKLRLENLHDIWAADRKGLLIPVFARSTGDDGPRFLSVAKKVAKEFHSSTDLQFAWIDPEPFPAMREHWQQTFQINPMEPSIGAVDVSKQTSAWLQSSSLSLKSDIVIKEIKQWLKRVIAGEIELQASKPMNTTRAHAQAQDAEAGAKDEL